MLRTLTLRPLFRGYATTPVKVSVALVARLRKETALPMSRAREALAKHENDYAAALAWLQAEEVASGAAKAAKLNDRTAADGLISVLAHHGRGSILELSCETDFVARNPTFQQLAGQVGATVLHLDLPVGMINTETLDPAPLLPHPDATSTSVASTEMRSVTEAIHAAVGKMGERVVVRRAMRFDALAPGETIIARTHGGKDAYTGRIGVLLRCGGAVNTENGGKIARQIAQHIIGMSPTRVDGEGEGALLPQDFLFGGGSVGEVAAQADLVIKDFVRWEIAEETQ